MIDRLADYGIRLETSPEELAARLPVNSEEYKHLSEQTMRELPSVEIWNDFFLKEYAIGRERLEPIAEELSFLYDYERPLVMRRPHLKETMVTLHGMGLRLGMISNIISRSVVQHFLEEYDIAQYATDEIDGLYGSTVNRPKTRHLHLSQVHTHTGHRKLFRLPHSWSR